MTMPTAHRAATGVVAFVALSLAILLAAAPATARPKDTADFTYKVIGFDYALNAVTAAQRESTVCVAGVTQDIGGNVKSSTAEIAGLGGLGEGEMHVEQNGTRGFIDARDDFTFDYVGSQRLTTVCEGGTTAQSAFQVCNDQITTGVAAIGTIRGRVGDQVRITWEFALTDLAGQWAPNLICGETIGFESKRKCQSTSSFRIEKLTRKVVKVPFTCQAGPTTIPPAGKGYDRYEAFASLSGKVKMKTTIDDR